MHPTVLLSMQLSISASSSRLGLPCNRPHEANELSCNRGTNNRGFLSARAQRAVTGGQAGLRFPGDLADLGRRGLHAIELFDANLRRMAISTSMWRTRPFPVLVIPPRRTVSPVDRSRGTRPRYAMSCRGLSKRLNADRLFRRQRSPPRSVRRHEEFAANLRPGRATKRVRTLRLSSRVDRRVPSTFAPRPPSPATLFDARGDRTAAPATIADNASSIPSCEDRYDHV